MADVFKETPATEDIHSPARGRLAALDEVPDEMFSNRILGDGFAVNPSDGVFRAPIAGELVLVADTLHAFAIRSKAGAEVLVHVGIDTVSLNGAGFSAKRAVGDRVEVGDEIILCDLTEVTHKVPSMLTPVIITNGETFALSSVDLTAKGGDPVALVSPV
ncbi:PTS glucose transporter subunit IIA [Streptomyces sp. OE57]|uniref:PTS sugar transporter subunit IIA n=1 Tax=Streptomyces lacaronensis TaxID=3379885 RepID=UPI0039B739C5